MMHRERATSSPSNAKTMNISAGMDVKNTHKDSLAARSVVLTVQHKGATKLDTMRMVMTPDLKLGVYQSFPISYSILPEATSPFHIRYRPSLASN